MSPFLYVLGLHLAILLPSAGFSILMMATTSLIQRGMSWRRQVKRRAHSERIRIAWCFADRGSVQAPGMRRHEHLPGPELRDCFLPDDLKNTTFVSRIARKSQR